MKFLFGSFLIIALAFVSTAQSSFDKELSELTASLGLSEKKLLELESIRASIKTIDQNKVSLWAEKYAKWDPDNKTDALNLSELILSHNPYDDVAANGHSYTGYGHEYLEYTLTEIEKDENHSISEIHAAFLRNVIMHQQEDKAIVQRDIKSILKKVDRYQKRTPYSTRDFRKLTDFIWKDNPELISASFSEIVNAVSNYDDQKMMIFARFAEANEMDLLGLYNVPTFDKCKVESGNATSFTNKLKSSYDLFAFVKTHALSRNADKWASFEFEKYKVFTENDDIRNVLLGFILLEKWQKLDNDWLDSSLTGREFKKKTGYVASKYLLAIETAMIDEMQLYLPIDKDRRSYLEQLLIATENEIYFILPAKNWFMPKIEEIDVFSFDLSEEERAIILEMQIPKGVGYEGSVLLRKDGVIQRLESSPGFRLAACVLLAQNGLKVNSTWFSRPVDMDPFNVYSSTTEESEEKKAARHQKRDQVYGQLRKVLLDNGNISKNYRIVYTANGQIRVSPNVASKVKGEMREVLEIAGIADDRFRGIPSYARFAIEMKLTAQEVEELGEVELQIQHIVPAPEKK